MPKNMTNLISMIKSALISLYRKAFTSAMLFWKWKKISNSANSGKHLKWAACPFIKNVTISLSHYDDFVIFYAIVCSVICHWFMNGIVHMSLQNPDKATCCDTTHFQTQYVDIVLLHSLSLSHRQIQEDMIRHELTRKKMLHRRQSAFQIACTRIKHFTPACENNDKQYYKNEFKINQKKSHWRIVWYP